MEKLSRLLFFLNDVQEPKGEVDYHNAGICFCNTVPVTENKCLNLNNISFLYGTFTWNYYKVSGIDRNKMLYLIRK